MTIPTNLYNPQRHNKVSKFQTQTTQATTKQSGTQTSNIQQGTTGCIEKIEDSQLTDRKFQPGSDTTDVTTRLSL